MLLVHFIVVVSRVSLLFKHQPRPFIPPFPSTCVHHYQPLPLPTRHLPASLSITIHTNGVLCVMCVNPRLICVRYWSILASVFSYFAITFLFLFIYHFDSHFFVKNTKNSSSLKHLHKLNRSAKKTTKNTFLLRLLPNCRQCQVVASVIK